MSSRQKPEKASLGEAAALTAELWRMLKPHRRSVYTLAILVAIQAGLNVGGAAALKELMDRFSLAQPSTIYYAVPLAVAAVLVALAFVNYGVNQLAEATGERIVAQVRQETYKNLLTLEQPFFDRSHSASLSSRLISDIGWIRTAIRHLYREGFTEPVVLLSLSGYLLYLKADLFGIALLVLPLFVWPVWKLGQRSRKLTGRLMDELAERAAAQQESLAATAVIKTYGGEQTFFERYRHRNQKAVATWVKLYRVSGLIRPVGMTLGGCVFAAIALLGYRALKQQTLTPGAYAAFMAGLVLFFRAVARLGRQVGSFMETLGALRRVFEMRDQALSAPGCASGSRETPTDVSVQFEEVTFAYDKNQPAVLDRLSLTVTPAEVVAVLGPSGSGKSTLLKLALGLYRPDRGTVKLGGVNPNSIPANRLAAQVGYLDQEATLFDASVRFNITLGRRLDPERIWQALSEADLAAFVRRLDEGLDTRVGESGHRLSAGQRRRLALARSLVHRPQILLLDEPTTSLDPAATRHVTETLTTLARAGRAILLVTHLTEAAEQADRIFTLAPPPDFET